MTELQARGKPVLRFLDGDELVPGKNLGLLLRRFDLWELARALPRWFGAKPQGLSVRAAYSRLVGARNYERVLGPMLSAVPSQTADELPADMLFKRRARRGDVRRSFTLRGGLQRAVEGALAQPGIETRSPASRARACASPPPAAPLIPWSSMISGVLVTLFGYSGIAIPGSAVVAASLQQYSTPEKASNAPIELRGSQEGDYFGVSVAAVDDVDGDGVKDLLVGANHYTTNSPFLGLAGQRREDRPPYAALYSGRDRRELLRIPAEAGGSQANFGLCVLGAADVDGDGRPDLAFGLPQINLATLIGVEAMGDLPGTAIEVRSSRDGRRLWSGSGQSGQFMGWSCALLDDVDGDGCLDLAVGGPTFDEVLSEVALHSGKTGKRIGALRMPKNACEFDEDFGTAVACLADLDNDGIRDVAVGYPGLCREGDRSVGAVYAYSAKNGTLLRTWTGQRERQAFGCAVAGLGDLDGDGVEEIAVGAFGDQEHGSFSGAAYVLSPQQERPLHRFEGRDHSQFGSALGTAGDYDGDGVDDVWVGAVRDMEDPEKRGTTVIFSGKTGAELARSPGGIAAALGDVNGDGCDDLAVGCHTEAQGRGVVRILFGHR